MRVPRFFVAVAGVAIVASGLVPPAAAATAPPPRPHPRPYGRGAARFHPTPVPPYRINDQRIALWFDAATGLIHGRTEIDVVDTTGATALPLDSVGLQYETVTLDGSPATFRTDAGHLIVDVADASDRDKTHTIVADYSGHPSSGLYFIKPDAAYRQRPPEVWTQGETEDNRRWFPTWDEPNMKFTTTVAVRVPHDWTVISNGALVSDTPVDAAGGEHVVTWREAKPHSSYLTSFVAGPYAKVHDQLGTLPVDYYVHPGHENEAKLCFGRTPQMIDFFQQFTGTRFAWEKYAQTTVSWFTAGGMENVSATTQTEFALHPQQYEQTQPCDGLVSHELAHQWFGDLVTTPDWPNTWINEGFATYFQELWTEHRFGKARFDYERYHAQDAYFRETERYWRPIVEYTYGTADDPFDASGYPRPAQVLHMLRTMLGDAGFRAAIKSYLAADSFKNVDTAEFQHQMEAASQRDLSWFFKEWFHVASHPNYVVSERYDARTHAEVLDVTQRNHGGALFRMPVTIAVTSPAGTVRRTIEIAQAHQIVTVPGVDAAPQMVLFDEGNVVLRTLVDHKSVAALAYQARFAPHVPDRLWVLARLGEASGADRPAARAAIRAAATGDSFWGVRVDAADAAAALDDAGTLRVMLNDADDRVRIAAARAVTSLDHANLPALASALQQRATTGDPSQRAAALVGYGATKSRAAKATLLASLGQPSPDDMLARGAVEGLGFLGDPATFDAVAAKAKYGQPDRTRLAAIAALGRYARVRATRLRAEAVLRAYLADPFFRARSAAAQALGRSRDKRVIAWLAPVRDGDSERGVRSSAWDAIADLSDARGPRDAERRR